MHEILVGYEHYKSRKTMCMHLFSLQQNSSRIITLSSDLCKWLSAVELATVPAHIFYSTKKYNFLHDFSKVFFILYVCRCCFLFLYFHSNIHSARVVCEALFQPKTHKTYEKEMNVDVELKWWLWIRTINQIFFADLWSLCLQLLSLQIELLKRWLSISVVLQQK